MKKRLNAFDLTMLGIGGIIGTGIFVLTGTAAAQNAGPAIVISFAISGFVAAFAALCYSEMAAMIPVSGSAYTYAYATMGELVAWIIGWDLILEYLVGASAVSVGWSGYFCSFLAGFGVPIHQEWTTAPFSFNATSETFHVTGAYVNLPAMVIVLAITALLILGIRESAVLNSVVVVIKVTVVIMFIVAAGLYINPSYWDPFIPENQGKFGAFGWSGILQAATTVFFAYIGFDAVSTTAQECKNPGRDLPIGICLSLAICTVLYILVALMLTGVVPYTQLNVPHPIAVGIEATGIKWLAPIIEVGAICGLTSVLLVLLLGQPRIFYSMAHDGLLPKAFGRLHHRFGTPWVTTLVTGVICAIVGGLLPIDVLAELTSVGTLFAFVLVSIGVMILRIQQPHAHRPFRVPFGPYIIPPLGALTSLLLIVTARPSTLLRLFIWMAVGIVIYVAYGRTHSVANRKRIEQKLSEIRLQGMESEETMHTLADDSVDALMEPKRFQ
jgi:APA family basic amino acid/polyamine antiporter